MAGLITGALAGLFASAVVGFAPKFIDWINLLLRAGSIKGDKIEVRKA